MHVAHDLAYSLRQASDSLCLEWLAVMVNECIRIVTNRYFPSSSFKCSRASDLSNRPALRPASGFLRPLLATRFGNTQFSCAQVEPDVERISERVRIFCQGAAAAKKGTRFRKAVRRYVLVGYE